MKCKNCKNEKIRILGKEYCPFCSKKGFNIKKHSGFYTGEKSIRAILWGVAASSSLAILVILFMRIFLPTIQLLDPFLVLLGIICFGAAGVFTVLFDRDYYLADNFVVSLILSLVTSTADWYFGATSYVMTFFSGLLVFFLTVSLGSFISLFIVSKDTKIICKKK